VEPSAGGTLDFSVRSPVATASVRGTAFDFDGTRLVVEEGRVHLSGNSVTGAYVGKGHSTAAAPETGSTIRVIDGLKAELSLPLPTGIDTVPAASAAAPASAGLGIIFDWPED
jgi:hypothetical protein